MANKKNLTVAAAAVAAVLAAAYPASSWYFGTQIEAAHAEVDAKIAALPYLKLVKHEYERNLFGANEVITIEIPASMFRLPPRPGTPPKAEATEETASEAKTEEPAEKVAEAAAQPAPATTSTSPQPAQADKPAAPQPLRITIRTAIQHGPFPGFSTLAAGSAKSVIEFDEPIQKKVLEAFGGKPALDIQTLYDFQGGGRSTATSPAFKLTLPGQTPDSTATLSGDGLEMVMEFTKSLEQYTVRGTAPRFELAEKDGAHITLAGLRMESEQQRMFPDDPLLYKGSQKFSLAEVSVDAGPDEQGKPRKFGLKELKYDVQVPATGEFIDIIARFGVTGLQIGEDNYGPANYDLSFKHLNARKLMALNRRVMGLYTKPEAMQDPEQLMQAIAPMKQQFVGVLLDSPTLSIDRISFKTNDGEAKVSASVKLNDAKAEDFNNPMMLMTKLEAAADLTLPMPLIATIASKDAADEGEAQLRKQSVEQTVAGIAQQGYVTVENGVVKSSATFKAGQLLVNGKPFNPMAMAAQPAPQELPPEAPPAK